MALALFAFSPAANAAPSPPSAKTSVTVFRLAASNDFEISAETELDRNSGFLYLNVVRRGEEADYTAKGRVTTNRIAFDLGSLGKIDLKILPADGTSKIHTGCGEGKLAAVPRVGLAGTFEFHGEEGFADATTTTMQAISVPVRDLDCGINEGEISGEGLPGTFLTVRRHSEPLLLSVVQDHPGGAVGYEAEIAERLGSGVRVTRAVRGREKGSAFTFDRKLSKARLEAGPRLSGVLTYTSTKLPEGPRGGEGKVGGDLVADFPGHAGVQIGGPTFTATIIHGERSSS